MHKVFHNCKHVGAPEGACALTDEVSVAFNEVAFQQVLFVHEIAKRHCRALTQTSLVFLIGFLFNGRANEMITASVSAILGRALFQYEVHHLLHFILRVPPFWHLPYTSPSAKFLR